jgi:ParB family chromosome partitioning protein
MSRKDDAALLASMSSRRDPVKLARDMEQTPFAQMAAQVKEQTLIPLTNVYVSPFQRRVEPVAEVSEEDEAYLTNLAATIERDGLLNPILVRVLDSSTDFSRKNRVLDSSTPAFGSRENAENTVLESSTPVADGPKYELIAGEHRVRAFHLLGRDAIPAKVLRLSNVEAARALTIDNLVRRGMTDWELYLHAVMLKEEGAASTQKELAGLLSCSRAKVSQLECYSRLPARAKEILNARPALLGASQVQALASNGFLDQHPDAVVEAVEKVAEGKIGQTGMVGFIERRVREEPQSDRREYQLQIGKQKVRVVSKDGETRISGDVDGDALRDILQAHLERLIKRPDQPLSNEDGA